MFKLSKLSKMILDNKTVTIVISLLLAIYAGLAAPALPNSVILFFDTWYGKILFMFLIAFVASHNVQIALMVAVVFFVILHLATQLEVEHFMSRRENFEDNPLMTTSTTTSSSLSEDDKKFIDWILSQKDNNGNNKFKNTIDMLMADSSKEASLKNISNLSGVSSDKIKNLFQKMVSDKNFEKEVSSYIKSKSKKEGFTDSEEEVSELFEDIQKLADAITTETTEATEATEATEGFESPLLNVSPADFSDDVGAPVDF